MCISSIGDNLSWYVSFSIKNKLKIIIKVIQLLQLFIYFQIPFDTYIYFIIQCVLNLTYLLY